MTHDSKAVIAAKREARAAKKAARAKKFVAGAERAAASAFIEDEGWVRAVVLETLRKANGTSKSSLLHALYRTRAGKRKKIVRVALESALAKLYLEGRVTVGSAHAGLGKAQRTVSMIYLRPTNDIPVNRMAASVIGPAVLHAHAPRIRNVAALRWMAARKRAELLRHGNVTPRRLAGS